MNALETKAFAVMTTLLNDENALELTANQLVTENDVTYDVALAAAKTALDEWSDIYCE
jgi:hypothetical protein